MIDISSTVLSTLRDGRSADCDGDNGELSDSDLEQVVGGLSRAWYGDASGILEREPSSFSVIALPPIELTRRVSA